MGKAVKNIAFAASVGKNIEGLKNFLV